MKKPVTRSDIRIVQAPLPPQINDDARQLLASGRSSMQSILGGTKQRERLFSRGLRWRQVVLAMHGDRAVGYASFKWHGRGGPFAPGLRDFLREYGWSGLWRYVAFWAVEARDMRSACYLYGLHVIPEYRSVGIGRLMIDAVRVEAQKKGVRCIELEVIDDNPRAQGLYRRCGFVTHKTVALGWLARSFGFEGVITMRLPLD